MLFSTPGVMADNNLLWQAIDYAANDPGISVSLDLSRFKAIVASRTDMDQAMEVDDVSPGAGRQGIYDKLLPLLAQWKQQFNFVGSYYVDIGNNPAGGETTNWAVSAPYYGQILALGNELGTHSPDASRGYQPPHRCADPDRVSTEQGHHRAADVGLSGD